MYFGISVSSICIFVPIMKKLGKSLVVSHYFTYFVAEKAPCVLLCGASVPFLIG